MSSTKEITIRPTGEQLLAWSDASGEQSLDAWLGELADNAARKRTWPCVITLKHPIDLGSDRIASLEFREGKLGDLRNVKVDGGGITIDQLMLIASRMCGQQLKVIEGLRGKDGASALAIARDFFTESLTGG